MNIQDAINRLTKYYPLDAPVCMVLWLADDVIKQAAERNMQITDELAAQILESLDDHHDANYGITWEHIDAELDAVGQHEGLTPIAKQAIFKFHNEDIGYCRVYVKHGKSLYCFQEEQTGLTPVLYVCTKEGEPEHPASIPENSKLELEGCEYLKDEITTAFNRGDYFLKAK